MTAAESLKALRAQAGLTQEQLAKKACVDRSWLNQMERGKRPIGPKPRRRLAEALGVSPLELGGGEADSPVEYRSLHDRLQELEAVVAGVVRAVAACVDALALELDEPALPEVHQRQPRGRQSR